MKTFIVVLCVCITFFGYAQKCEEVIDPITNDKFVEYKYQFKRSGVVFPFYPFEFKVKNGKATFEKEFSYRQLMNVSASEGTIVFFKLENGTILKLKTIKEALPKVTAAYRVVTSYNFVFELTKTELVALSESPLILIRLPKLVEEGYIDWDKNNDIFKRNRKPIMKGADCIKGYL